MSQLRSYSLHKFSDVIFIKIKFHYLNIKILIISNIRYTNNNINLKEKVFYA